MRFEGSEAAKPGGVALGELAGRGDEAIAQLVLAESAFEKFPGLPVAHRAHARQRGMQGKAGFQGPYLVDQSRGEHRVEARGNVRVELRPLRNDRERLERERQWSVLAQLDLRQRLAGHLPDLQRALDALRVVRLDALRRLG